MYYTSDNRYNGFQVNAVSHHDVPLATFYYSTLHETMANIECLTYVIPIYTFRQLENMPTLLVLSVEPLGKSSISGICVDKHTESQSAL